ncbi:hypothetical protein ACA910_020839 [Epithemia clementina (nom. ined.)]
MDRVRQTLDIGKRNWKIGLVYSRVPFWSWVVGTLGNVLWLRSHTDVVNENDLPVKLRMKFPAQHCQGKVPTLASVNQEAEGADLILFDGEGPGRLSEDWALQSAKLIVRTNRKSRNAPPPSQEDAWINEQIKISHGSLGGLLDDTVWFTLFKRKSLSNKTITATSRATKCGRDSDSTEERSRPLRKGLPVSSSKKDRADIQWRQINRNEMQLPYPLPCVFSRMGFVRRMLTRNEMGSIHDFPLEVLRSTDQDRLKRWVALEPVPFKICHEIVQRLKCWSSGGYLSKDTPSSSTEIQEQTKKTGRNKPHERGGACNRHRER